MPLWSSCFFFVALSLGKTLVAGFHLKGLCATSGFFVVQKSNIMRVILSFTVCSEVLWVASLTLTIRDIPSYPEFEAAQLPGCAYSC